MFYVYICAVFEYLLINKKYFISVLCLDLYQAASIAKGAMQKLVQYA